jgi:hypothetical protein
MITYTRKILYTTPADQHDGVFLQVMAFPWDISDYFNFVS